MATFRRLRYTTLWLRSSPLQTQELDRVSSKERCLHRRRQATCRRFAQHYLCAEKRTILTCARAYNCSEQHRLIFLFAGLMTSLAQPTLWPRLMRDLCLHHGGHRLQEAFPVQQSLLNRRGLHLQGARESSSDRTYRQRGRLPLRGHRHLQHNLTLMTRMSLIMLQRSSRRLLLQTTRTLHRLTDVHLSSPTTFQAYQPVTRQNCSQYVVTTSVQQAM